MDTELKDPRETYHIKKDGRVFQMFNPYGTPIPFRDAKHNYTKGDLDGMGVGDGIGFIPMFGNTRPIQSVVRRIR